MAENLATSPRGEPLERVTSGCRSKRALLAAHSNEQHVVMKSRFGGNESSRGKVWGMAVCYSKMEENFSASAERIFIQLLL